MVMAKAALQKPQIPVDPEGKVKLLIFLDERVPESKQLVESITPLRNQLKGNPDVSVVGLTKRTYSAAGLKLRGAELSFPFPLLSGEALALELRIQSYPTFVFVAATSKQTYRIEGIPSLQEIERTVKVMRGGR
jgi:thioredoxin-related protein